MANDTSTAALAAEILKRGGDAVDALLKMPARFDKLEGMIAELAKGGGVGGGGQQPDTSEPKDPGPLTLKPLPDWDVFKYAKEMQASQWSGGNFHQYEFHSDNIRRLTDKSVELRVGKNSGGGWSEAELQAGAWLSKSAMRVEVDVTLGKMRSGVIAAPLYMLEGYDGKVPDGAFEIDFEVVGLNGLQLNLHQKGKELAKPFIPAGFEGDLSGRRMRLATVFKLPGYVSWEINGKEVYRLTEGPAGPFQAVPMRTFINIWAQKGMDGWAGKYTAPTNKADEPTMIIHGYASAPFTNLKPG